jgi:hypothetical protein
MRGIGSRRSDFGSELAAAALCLWSYVAGLEDSVSLQAQTHVEVFTPSSLP